MDLRLSKVTVWVSVIKTDEDEVRRVCVSFSFKHVYLFSSYFIISPSKDKNVMVKNVFNIGETRDDTLISCRDSV